jgi:hypothetical protein
MTSHVPIKLLADGKELARVVVSNKAIAPDGTEYPISKVINKLEMPPIFWKTLDEMNKREALRSVQSGLPDIHGTSIQAMWVDEAMEAGEIPPPTLDEIREQVEAPKHDHGLYMDGFRIGKIGCPACDDEYWKMVGTREPHAD